MKFDKKPDDDQDKMNGPLPGLQTSFSYASVIERDYNQARDLMFCIPLTEQYPKEEEAVLPFVIDLRFVQQGSRRVFGALQALQQRTDQGIPKTNSYQVI